MKSGVLSTGCGQKRQHSACLQGACTAAGGMQTSFWKTQSVEYVWEWWVSHDLQIPLYPHVLWVAPHLHLCLDGNTAQPENLWGHLTSLLQRAILCLPCTLIQAFNCLSSPLTLLLFLMALYFVTHWRCHTQWCTVPCKVCRWFEHPSEHPSEQPWSLVHSTHPPGCAIDIRVLSGPASTPSILTSWLGICDHDISLPKTPLYLGFSITPIR